jgi:hypothetical protein
LSSRKDDSQNKNIRYYNIFTSNGSNAKMIDNQKKLKISGSAVLGLPKMRNDSNQTYRNSLSYNRNEKENNKDIYLDKEIINNLKCVKDQDLIDKPLILYTKNYFRIDPTKSKIENKLIELEYFTKKKFDELIYLDNFINVIYIFILIYLAKNLKIFFRIFFGISKIFFLMKLTMLKQDYI